MHSAYTTDGIIYLTLIYSFTLLFFYFVIISILPSRLAIRVSFALFDPTCSWNIRTRVSNFLGEWDLNGEQLDKQHRKFDSGKSAVVTHNQNYFYLIP